MTRAEIEEIRGVTTSKGTLDVLLETGWIRPRGRRKAPGRPLTYGTTEGFLSHFGPRCARRSAGPRRAQRRRPHRRAAAGGLQRRRMPSDDPALREDEEPLSRATSTWTCSHRWSAPRNRRRLCPGRDASAWRSSGPPARRPSGCACFCRPWRIVSDQNRYLAASAAPLRTRRDFMGSLSIWHWMIVLAVGLLLFGGAARFPS